MLIKTLSVVTAMSLTLAVNVTHAHSASQHKKEKAEKPNCLAMKKMDQSKIDKNDPIMQAMMQQCTPTNEHEAEQHNGDDKTAKHEKVIT
ncbi:MAG: biopolymer transport protein ExbD [Oceanospirillaceae bacterium]|jgi:biopolymer transport protein ExbD